MKLMPSVDFILHIHSLKTKELCDTYPKRFKITTLKGRATKAANKFIELNAIKWDIVKEYAKFLKKPLTLSMFVPVDEKGNVLEEPNFNPIAVKIHKLEDKVKACEDAYNKAKSKVLFEDVYYCAELKSISTGVDYPNSGSIIAVYPNDNKEFCSMRYKTIEDLIPLDLTLTDHAKSLIF